MVSTRVRSEPKSSPRVSSVASTPKVGRRRLTPGSVTPKSTKGKAASKPKTKAPTNGRKAVHTNSGRKGKAEVDEDEPSSTEDPSSSDDDDDSEDAFDPDTSASEEEVVEDDEESDIDSDFLDEDDDDFGSKKKRKYVNGKAGGSAKTAKTVNGGRKATVADDDDEEEGEMSDVELEEGQTIAARIYPAPKNGQVPPGRISMNTLKFLRNLQIPERNDREWFRSHEPAYRQAEKEWKAFVEKIQLKFFEADNDVPILPTKDVIHRIYRDVRFSSDKTPYKKSFSMSTSRGGRKGIWAGYYLAVSPNGNSILAAGVWQPQKDELATIRHNVLRNPATLRDAISQPDFVELFGPPKLHPKGKRQNVFGHDDALKVAPKLEGVDKTHKDIDLLKLRSIAVVKHFDDEEVLEADFQDKIKSTLDVMAPFVHMLNDLMTIRGGEDAASDDDDEEGADNDDDDDA